MKLINFTYFLLTKMKHDFKKMEEEMDKLAANMSTITEFSEKITGTLQGKRQQITKLSGVHALLKKVLCSSVWFSDIILQISVYILDICCWQSLLKLFSSLFLKQYRGSGRGGPEPAFPLFSHENHASRAVFHHYPESRFSFPKKHIHLQSNFYKS